MPQKGKPERRWSKRSSSAGPIVVESVLSGLTEMIILAVPDGAEVRRLKQRVFGLSPKQRVQN